MIVKFIICLCICIAMFFGSVAGLCKALDFVNSKKSNVEIFGVVLAIAIIMLMFAGISGMVVFTIKLFILYLYGVA